MTSRNPQTPYAILVGMDHSESSSAALTQAIAVARLHAPSHIHVVRAVPAALPYAGAPDALSATSAALEQEVARVSDELQENVRRALGPPTELERVAPSLVGVVWTTHVRLAEPVQAIAQLAADLEVDLVVVGTHGRRGLARFLLGSVAEGVVRHAPCPVLVVRAVGAQSAADVPKIEPACPRCVTTRRATRGQELWCAQHREHHERRHTYHFSPFRSAHQSGLLYPT